LLSLLGDFFKLAFSALELLSRKLQRRVQLLGGELESTGLLKCLLED